MKYYNYTDLGIVSNKKPVNTHLFIECSDGDLYLVDSGDDTEIYKSTDKGDNWTQPNGDFSRGNNVVGMYYDRTNEYIYFVEKTNDFYKIVLNDDSISTSNVLDGSVLWYDIIIVGGVYTVFGFIDSAGNLFRGASSTTASYTFNLGVIGALTWDYSFGAVVGDYYYYLFQWSNGNPLLYKQHQPNEGVATVLAEDCGANLQIPSNFNQKGIAYDGNDILYFVLQDTGDSKYYLYTYIISTDTLTKRGEYNIALMLDRSTATGILEKAFYLTEYKIYQLQTISTQLHFIAIPDSDALFVGITDNFLMNNDGDVFEHEDQIGKIILFDCVHKLMEAPHAVVTIKKDAILLEETMVMKFLDNYTTAGATSEGIMFEGKIISLGETPKQLIILESFSKHELREVKPSGDYSGRSDEILTSLLSGYCNYITKGTFSAGTAMGTITFGGEQSLEDIIDKLTYFENWVWYLTPTGALYFNDGTVDSVENLSESNKVFHALPRIVHEEYNKIKVRGAYVDGVQVESDWYEDLESQQTTGVIEKILDFSFLDTAALCNICASNLLTRLALTPIQVKFNHQNGSVGFIQPGETITFEFESEGVTIASDQFIIEGVVYNDQSIGYYTISDELP